MDSIPLTFDQLPAYVVDLGRKVDQLTALLSERTGHNQPVADRWFSIEELSKYLPGNPAITTLYGKVQRREIPFSRTGKRLVFRQSEIDTWLHSQRSKTSTELEIIAETFVRPANSRSGGRKAA